MRSVGFLFLLILALGITSRALGYKLDDYDADAKLQHINEAPGKFKIGLALQMIEHAVIIALAVSLFVQYGSYNGVLGPVWLTFRTGEALVHFAGERDYWGLRRLAQQYSVADEAERTALGESGRVILLSKNTRFTQAMVLFGIGTLAYSIVFLAHDLVPSNLARLGIVVGALDVVGSGIRLARPTFVALAYLGGLLTLIFEVLIGGWLLFS